MLKYLFKWFVASLIVPAITIVFSSVNYSIGMQQLTLLFWPSSIFLMSLGGNERPLADIVYVWSIAVGVNIILYLVVGLLIFWLCSHIKARNSEKL
jgi:hypothetical protein